MKDERDPRQVAQELAEFDRAAQLEEDARLLRKFNDDDPYADAGCFPDPTGIGDLG